MSDTPPAPPDVAALVELARRFADRKLFDEALELFQVALRLDPKNLGIRLALARLRNLQRARRGPSEPKDPAEVLREELRRNRIDAAQFVGLAWLYAERGEEFRSLECLEIARAKDPHDPANFKLAGRIHFRLQDYDTAAERLERALRYNPFDRETAELLSQVKYERKRYPEALAAAIDAFLLLPPTDEERALRLRRRIRTLRQLMGWSNAQIVALFREREELLHLAFDRLAWRREQLKSAEGLMEAPAIPPAEGGRLTLATRLRRAPAWAHLSDEQVFKLSGVTEELELEGGATVIPYLSHGRDLYLLEEGEVAIQRPTPYGTFTLALLKPGTLLGEVNLVSAGTRTAEVVASRPSRLFRMDGEALEKLAEDWPEFGVQLYWGLWHSMAAKLRATNEQLRTFFPAEQQSETFLKLRRAAKSPVDTAEITAEDKRRVFEEQGLSGHELQSLAGFSRELRIEPGNFLFEEGDDGHEMYVIVEGKVLISKHIPGAGEEALAILERGDFFGEMALIDGERRSADARAHDGPVTVLALDQSTIQNMLLLDPQAARDFLKLLCRLIGKRLREIDEKVVTWRIFAGPQNQVATA
jgi:CRP-like cAMP-binding protein/cytochrome c-type biogenesis protein CcmH/NrfG